MKFLIEKLFSKIINFLYLKKEKSLREKYDRSLSFQDGFFSRFERAERMGFSKGVTVYNSSNLFGDIVVGESSWIGPNTLLDGTGGLKIGSFCSISSGAQILTHDTVKWCLTGGNHIYEYAETFIGDYCFIGTGSVITKGITIGDCCIVGAGAVVTKSFPPYSIIVGVPAKKVGYIIKTDNNVELKFY